MCSIKILFGRKLRELRKKRDLTQAQLAEIVSVDDKHISCLESGKNFPSPELLERFASAFHVEPKDLFEFYHLQNPDDLIADMEIMLQKLTQEELVLVYKYIRTFLIK
ncbi:helix-turn-helix transcriptional regulator [bacterium]|nr:helix-turn-helix transcriptional regulator [bacterium]